MSNDLTLRNLSKSKVWDYENGFYWFSPKTRINKMLAHFELYKKIVSLPGHIFELGVFKGASLLRFATFRDLLENDYSRKIIGFDAFGEFPIKGLKEEDDLKFIKSFETEAGDGLKENEILSLVKNKGFENIELVKGNIFDTIPKFLKKNPETRLSFLHLDLDVKEPTDFALEILYDRIVPGGIIVFDDYNSVSGETISADNFLKRFNLKIKKLPFYNVPSYIEKIF